MTESSQSPGPARGFSLAGEIDGAAWLNPLGLIDGAAAAAAIRGGTARALAGGPLAFTHCEMAMDDDAGETGWHRLDLAARQRPRVAAALARLSHRRPPFAGLELDRPRVMGVVNVTPDSFYDRGAHGDPAGAIAQGRALIEAGADIIDVGGESTRPGAEPTPAAVERARILPVIAALAGEGVPVSVDTRHAPVMAAAIEAGARIVNDVSALTDDRAALALVAAAGVAVILGHKPGAPRDMHRCADYRCPVLEVAAYLAGRVRACEAAGMAPGDIAVDPGFGFGKTAAHNAAILARIGLLHCVGCAVVIGASRKRFAPRTASVERAADRLPATIAVTALAAAQGVQIHRVHDVAAARQALAVVAAARTTM
jgi:dihydropteroate synthase